MDNTLTLKFKEEDCNDETKLYSKKCNKLLLKKELLERDYLEENPEENLSLYPDLNDPNFNVKIASRKEFNDYQYDGELHDIKTRAEELSNVPFELAPHQMFIKNYLSFQTPYNSLLLFHQLGTGKTCSAIGVTEEMRTYLKDVGITKRIIIVASPNVQENFKLQLFDERKLTQVNGLWKMDGCIGDKFIREINPTNVKDIPKEKIISQIKSLIDKSYLFRGYEGFSNFINKASGIENPNITEAQVIRNLKTEFSNRLIVIDEVHNIRTTQDNANKKIADQLMKMVKHVENIRLLLLSATPMYNSVREIIWLLNLMNMNDKRARVDIKEIFDNKGNFKTNGEDLLRRKTTGYISYVRGENPYTFPFRVYPDIFNPVHSFLKQTYPSYQMNGKYIPSKERIQSLKKTIFLSDISMYQSYVYKIMLNKIQKQLASQQQGQQGERGEVMFEKLDSFNYTLLQYPLESLIMTYPLEGVVEFAQRIDDIRKDKPEIEENLETDDEEDNNLPSGFDEEEINFELKEEFQDQKQLSPKRKRCPNGSRFNKKIEECVTIKTDSNEEIEEIDEEKFSPKPEILVNVEDEPEVNVELTNRPSSEASIRSEEYDELQKGGEESDEEQDGFYLDTSSLTGKKGLNRVMNYVDSMNPPTKGKFSYKSTTKFGRIFSSGEIGKYSTKIKAVSESILNSDGIILIYSQWLDSGLIPMALALEELGFTRANGSPLFETPQTEPIDSLTLEPKNENQETGFVQAKYALISGDSRISPNNTEEIKMLTNDNNFNGKQVKVVLISKAASEGIDLKNIRQVHILEPWYTMSRIEQIIGRAVRSFSHQKLPFEERNVEIFLHGTILKDKESEAADLYIYRLAEYKAGQIGEVTRILKESAIDCLLNTQQNNFTQEQMNVKIKQKLSDGRVLDSFRVGDMPYSAMCDYMKNCAVKCVPEKSIVDVDINNSTYSEGFITMNSEKIIQKIKNLMKEEFFYKKSDLMAKLNYPKAYPHVEIYSALTHLISDVTEIITDKYNRQGRLINIGEYYLFQPLELTNKNASVFDRSVPVDYKPSDIKLISSKPNNKIPVESLNEEENEVSLKVKTSKTDEILNKIELGKSIVKEIEEDYAITLEYLKGQTIPRNEKDYYKHMGFALQKIYQILQIESNKLLIYVLYHAIETLPYEKKIQLLNYVTNLETNDKDSVDYKIKLYFDTFLIMEKYLTAIILYEGKKRHILIFNKRTKEWKDAEPEDERDLTKAITEKYTVNTTRFNKYLGLIADQVFKLKDSDNKRSHGTTCQQTTKSKNLIILNKLVDAELFTKESIKPLTDIGVCCIQEILLRYFNDVKPEKIWFVNGDTAQMYNL